MTTPERMTDERLEEIRRIAADLRTRYGEPSTHDSRGPFLDLLAEVDRLRDKYEKQSSPVIQAWGGGTHNHITGTLRVTLTAWLKHGPTWVRGGLVNRVELTDKEPRFTDRCGYRWYRSEAIDSCESTPHSIGVLYAHLPQAQAGSMFYKFDGAKDALSEAALAWAKEQPE